MMKKSAIIEIISLLFIALFMYAAVAKLVDIEKFQVQVAQSPLLSDYAVWIAWTIPLTEIGISMTLSIPRFRIVGLYASFTLMTLFTCYIVAILQFSERIPCSCGGILESMGWHEHLIFNVCFVFLGLTAIALHSKKASNNSRSIA